MAPKPRPGSREMSAGRPFALSEYSRSHGSGNAAAARSRVRVEPAQVVQVAGRAEPARGIAGGAGQVGFHGRASYDAPDDATRRAAHCRPP